jgi:hypothetical protein
MRKAWVGFLLIFVAFSAFPAVQYDFTQRTQSDIEQIRPSNLSGRAIIDGDHSRVDFLTGDLYPPGSYCISTNGSRTLTFVDPAMKSYTEVNAASVAAAVGQSNITITNLKSDMQKLSDHPNFAGLSTEHYHLTISFDMAVEFHSMPLRQSVQTEIDKWTTIEYADIADTFLAASPIRTGNQQIDELIDLETNKIKGFPLKQTVKITTTNLQGTAPGSKLVLSAVRTQSREMIVTSIKRLAGADPSAFTLPASYRRNDTQALAEKSAQTRVTVLSFDEGKTQ